MILFDDVVQILFLTDPDGCFPLDLDTKAHMSGSHPADSAAVSVLAHTVGFSVFLMLVLIRSSNPLPYCDSSQMYTLIGAIV
jgi:hypothetical protein